MPTGKKGGKSGRGRRRSEKEKKKKKKKEIASLASTPHKGGRGGKKKEERKDSLSRSTGRKEPIRAEERKEERGRGRAGRGLSSTFEGGGGKKKGRRVSRDHANKVKREETMREAASRPKRREKGKDSDSFSGPLVETKKEGGCSRRPGRSLREREKIEQKRIASHAIKEKKKGPHLCYLREGRREKKKKKGRGHIVGAKQMMSLERKREGNLLYLGQKEKQTPSADERSKSAKGKGWGEKRDACVKKKREREGLAVFARKKKEKGKMSAGGGGKKKKGRWEDFPRGKGKKSQEMIDRYLGGRRGRKKAVISRGPSKGGGEERGSKNSFENRRRNRKKW